METLWSPWYTSLNWDLARLLDIDAIPSTVSFIYFFLCREGYLRDWIQFSSCAKRWAWQHVSPISNLFHVWSACWGEIANSTWISNSESSHFSIFFECHSFIHFLGQARIRVQLSAVHSEEDVNRAVDAFITVGKELKVIWRNTIFRWGQFWLQCKLHHGILMSRIFFALVYILQCGSFDCWEFVYSSIMWWA